MRPLQQAMFSTAAGPIDFNPPAPAKFGPQLLRVEARRKLRNGQEG